MYEFLVYFVIPALGACCMYLWAENSRKEYTIKHDEDRIKKLEYEVNYWREKEKKEKEKSKFS